MLLFIILFVQTQISKCVYFCNCQTSFSLCCIATHWKTCILTK